MTIEIIDKITMAVKVSSESTPYWRPKLAVARVVDIWALVIIPIPRLVVGVNPMKCAPINPLRVLLVISETTIRSVKRASPGAKRVVMLVVIPKLRRKIGIRNP